MFPFVKSLPISMVDLRVTSFWMVWIPNKEWFTYRMIPQIYADLEFIIVRVVHLVYSTFQSISTLKWDFFFLRKKKFYIVQSFA